MLYIEIEKLYNHSNLVGLACKLLLNQSEVNLSWEKGDNETSSLDASLEYTNQSLILLFNNSKVANPGEYVCTAKAVNSKNILKKYVIIEPPSKPIKIKSLTSYITWNLYSSLPITDCKVQYGNVNAFGVSKYDIALIRIRFEAVSTKYNTYKINSYTYNLYIYLVSSDLCMLNVCSH